MPHHIRALWLHYLSELARYWDDCLVVELNSGLSAAELARKYGISPLTALALERGNGDQK